MSILSASAYWPELRHMAQRVEQDGADTRVRPDALRDIVQAIVAKPDLWSGYVRFDLSERFFTRLHHASDFEVWLICWELGQDTLLHDHGGSVGAFALAHGSLIEDYGDVRGGQLRTRTYAEGETVAFGVSYLHNLVNIFAEPAVSVHAYSRPLAAMNFYCWLPSGAHHLREIPCESPEPDTTALEAAAARMRAEATS